MMLRRLALGMLIFVPLVTAASCSTASEPQPGIHELYGTPAPAEVAVKSAVTDVVAATDTAVAGRGDSGANPVTALGRLRARYLPVWSSDLDWAFPPEVCDSAWEFDAIAQPDADADVGAMGNATTAAALSVLRFEHLTNRAFAAPRPLAQLCVAVASVDPARREILAELAPLIRLGTANTVSSPTPDAVTIVAAAPSQVLAIACVPVPQAESNENEPDSSGSDPNDATANSIPADSADSLEQAPAQAEGSVSPTTAQTRLAAYLLVLSRGVEDSVIDVSWRVSETKYASMNGCEDLTAWTAQWRRQAQKWAEEGRPWRTLDMVFQAYVQCESPPPEGPDECPQDWSR